MRGSRYAGLDDVVVLVVGRGLVHTGCGYLSIKSNQGLQDGPFCSLRKDFQMAVLHLKPEPRAICHTMSPFRTLFLASMYAKTYQIALEDVLPHLCRVMREGSMCQSESLRCSIMPSMTALPPGWIQKWSTPVLKSGIYAFMDCIFNTLRAIKFVTYLNFSENGRMSGATLVKLFFNAIADAGTMSFESVRPLNPSSSSPDLTQLKLLSSAPLWVLTTCISWYLAFFLSPAPRSKRGEHTSSNLDAT